MKKSLIIITMFIAGCANKPQHYDLSTSGVYPPITTNQNIPALIVKDFKYEPHINISQHTISHLGCLPCQADGSTSGFVFVQPIRDIVLTEIEAALKEVMLPSVKTNCELSATVHLAAWDVMDGDSIVDLTYVLSSSGQIKLIKRIRGHHDSGLFEANKIDRLLAKASR